GSGVGRLEARDAHRLVHRSPAGHAVEEQKLIRGEPEERAHPGIELGERAVQMWREPPVEMPPPAERAVDDLRAERIVARVEAGEVECMLEHDVSEGLVLLDADQDAERLVARLRDWARLQDRA